jgi:hypothetical protein
MRVAIDTKDQAALEAALVSSKYRDAERNSRAFSDYRTGPVLRSDVILCDILVQWQFCFCASL